LLGSRTTFDNELGDGLRPITDSSVDRDDRRRARNCAGFYGVSKRGSSAPSFLSTPENIAAAARECERRPRESLR
jgi:hypothetical protein